MNTLPILPIAFPNMVMVFIVASAIMLFSVSLLQDRDRLHWRYSLLHLLFFIGILATMLGVAMTLCADGMCRLQYLPELFPP